MPPSITTQPQSRTNLAGTTATFVVTADGTAPLSYQWLFNGTNLTDNGHIVGSQSNSLTISTVAVSDRGDYQGHITAINLADGSQRVFNANSSDQAVHFAERPDTPDASDDG